MVFSFLKSLFLFISLERLALDGPVRDRGGIGRHQTVG